MSLALAAAPIPPGRAATPVDLGPDMAYLRVREPGDLADTSAIAGRPLIVDFRFSATDAADLPPLRELLAAHDKAKSLFVLVGPATPAIIADALAGPRPGAITLGIAGSRPTPDVVVRQSPEADRAAYDAADRGTPLAALISGRLEKERYDESSLAKDFANGHHDAAPPPPPDPTAPAATKANPPPAPPLDRVLQRAVQLQLARLAIRPR